MTDQPRLLVVDDDEIQREVVRRWLAGDYELYDAQTGTEALAMLPTVEFAAVLLDYRLPDYNGLELLPTMVGRNLPVVMFTSLVDEQMAAEALRLGARGYLAKDKLSRDNLVATVAQALAVAKPSV